MTDRRHRLLSDHELGMSAAITRRDFLQGVAVGAAGVAASAALAGCGHRAIPLPVAAQDLPGYYPPGLTGLRGSHVGSFEVAHALRDGAEFGLPADTDETYDLVVVGAGISGLSAAWFYRAQKPDARILILDNHDDFGGHAKRNEFTTDGVTRLMNGGTYAIESPRPYSAIADGLLRAVGIDAPKLAVETQKKNVYKDLGLGTGVWFDRETFGSDRLAGGYRARPWPDFLHDTPLSAAARADVLRVETGRTDYLPGLDAAGKKAKLLRMSYRDYLRDLVGVGPEALALYQTRTQGWWAVGIDAVSALDAWGAEMPGFDGLRLPPGSIPGMGYTPAGFTDTGGSVFLHFPDGNATVARSLVRSLIPESVPGRSVEDLITARADYRRLDRGGDAVRIRLLSTVVRVRHDAESRSGRPVEVAYVRGGRTLSVRARHCVLACYNAIIPYLVPDLPADQKTALHQAVKSPLVYTGVLLRQWRPFRDLGVHDIHAPGGFHTSVRLTEAVDIGSYTSPRSPNEPMVLWMTRTPCKPGLSEKDQNRAGRAELYSMPFETFERNTREQLTRMLAGSDFNAARDIAAITVNRWPHGYAPENNALWESDEELRVPAYERARVRFGPIAIANSDAGAGAYTDVAIDQAHRAVHDLLGA